MTFPESAAFGKKIPFAALQKQGVPRRFGALIKSIVWSYKLAPDTIGLAATKAVTEIEVIDLAVKQAGASLRVRSSVMEMLNLRIPNPCIFRVTDEAGGPIETAIYPKVSGGVLYGDSAVFRYARRDPSMDGRAQDEWPSGVTTLESLLIHLAAELAGMSVRPGEPLKLFDERHYAVESLRAELADIEKKLSKEKQLNRKYELAKSKQRVLAKLEAVK